MVYKIYQVVVLKCKLLVEIDVFNVILNSDLLLFGCVVWINMVVMIVELVDLFGVCDFDEGDLICCSCQFELWCVGEIIVVV